MATPPALPIGRGHVGPMAPSPTQLSALNDDLLLEIFLRIHCPADLTRASAVCIAFRHLITDPVFIRRYRSHHPPLLLGFFSTAPSKDFYPVEAPHPNAAAARAVSNISFDYLPPAKSDLRWYIADVRDGRVLLQCAGFCCNSLPDIIAVCDPLSQRYRVLPPLPNYGKGKYLTGFDLLLAPCAENMEERSFRVICMAQYYREFLVLVFDSGCSSWTLSACSRSWDALSLSNKTSLSLLHCAAYGCFYWEVLENEKLLKLDTRRMELSTVVLPPRHGTRDIAVVEVGEGILGMLSYNQHRKVFSYYHYNDQIVDKWQKKKVIPLPVDHDDDLLISEALQGYLFVEVYLKQDAFARSTACYCYSLDVKTLKFERVRHVSSDEWHCLPYFGFPPPLSPRLI